jgi:hypothetical protein
MHRISKASCPGVCKPDDVSDIDDTVEGDEDDDMEEE